MSNSDDLNEKITNINPNDNVVQNKDTNEDSSEDTNEDNTIDAVSNEQNYSDLTDSGEQKSPTKKDENKIVVSSSDDINLNHADPSRLTLYTIPKGTLLYHGSSVVDTFNPTNIRLGKESLVAFFSPNKEISSDYIMRCSNYPNKNGFVHMFRTKNDVDKIRILSQYDLQNGDKNFKHIEETFCNAKPGREFLNGIGFFFQKKDIDKFKNINEKSDNILHNSEFALCNPNLHLEYISTQKCVSNRKLGDSYNFHI